MVGIDGRELQGRPTGTGRYLRNLLRAWPPGPDRLLVYGAGRLPEDPVLSGRGVEPRALAIEQFTTRLSGRVWN